jgi:hypothetical protein
MARAMYRAQIGDVLRRSFPLAVGGIAILHEYDLLASRWWMWGWLGLFALTQVSEYYLAGLAADRFRFGLDQVHGSFAGSIDNLTRQLVLDPNRRLDETACKAICVGLLSRIKRYVTHMLNPDGGNRIRVTIAVPLPCAAGTKTDNLRIWCYDETYPDRRWTTLPVASKGAGEAFATGLIQTIDDIRTVLDAPGREHREFRSVVSVPVEAGGPSGTPLAVINVDSTVVGFFTPDHVKRILPSIAPAINVIALALLTRSEGADYAFHS